MELDLRKPEECTFDAISLGEIMLRLDPGDGRIRTARSFRAWEGGGEYNVARGLRRCFGLKTSAVTALADNEVGRLVEDFMLQGGVDTSLIKWVKYDGIGRTVRNGLNFTEKGFGIRGAVGVSDRGNTAVSKLKAGDIDWDYIFGTLAFVGFIQAEFLPHFRKQPRRWLLKRLRLLKNTERLCPTTLTIVRLFGTTSAVRQRHRRSIRKLQNISTL